MTKRLLAVLAHRDDEAFGTGATLVNDEHCDVWGIVVVVFRHFRKGRNTRL